MAIVTPPRPYPPGRPFPPKDTTVSGPAVGVRLICEVLDAHRIKATQVAMNDYRNEDRWTYSVWCRTVFDLKELCLALRLPEPAREGATKWASEGTWADCDIRAYCFITGNWPSVREGAAA